MKTIRRAVKVVALGLCAVAVTPSAMAEAQRGFYVGVSGGESTYDIDKEELDDITFDAFASVGAFVISRTSTFEDGDTSAALFAGYRFSPYIAVEAGYLNLGTAEYRFSGTVNPPGPVTSESIRFNIDIESKGLTLAGIGSVPIGKVVDLHGRLGFIAADTELAISIRGNSGTSTDSESLESVSLLVGLGVGFHLGEHWSLSLDWTRYDNVGDEDDDDDYETEAGFDISAVSFSAAYRF